MSINPKVNTPELPGVVPMKANAQAGFTITPSDTADLAVGADALYIGVTGNIKVDMPGLPGQAARSTVTFMNVPVGFFPVAVLRVYATGTTASQIIGMNW
jgi:hypothetical protein